MPSKTKPKQLRYSEEPLDDEISAGYEIDIKSTIFFQLDRINRAVTYGMGNYTQSVSVLESILAPYIDEDFDEEIKKVNNFYNWKREKMIGEGGAVDQNADFVLLEYITTLKYRALIKLCQRRNMLPIGQYRMKLDKRKKQKQMPEEEINEEEEPSGE